MKATINIELKLPAKKNGECTLYLRITQAGKHWRVKIGHAIHPKHWNDETKRVKASHPFYKSINDAIEQKEMEARNEILKSKVNKTALSPSMLQRTMVGEHSESFLRYSVKIAERIKQKNFNTFEQYQTALNKLNKYLKGKELMFDDITVDFLKTYRSYLQGLGNNQTTVYNSFKVIRAIFYHAIQDEIVPQDKNPFFRFKFSAGKANRTKLTPEGIKQIESLEVPPGNFLYHSRNYFLFSYYCAGMRIRDVLQLRWSNISNERINYNMSKTGIAKSLKLIDKAQAILSLYRTPTSKPTHYVFPSLKDTRAYTDQTLRMHIRSIVPRINVHLKQIARLAGILRWRTMSTHVARHSMADVARKKGVNIYDISKLLGHSSLRVTEAYLKNDDEQSRDKAMDSIYD